MEKRKLKYNVFQNTIFIMKRYARDSWQTVAVSLIQAPVKVAIQFLVILLPSVVLKYLEMSVAPPTLIAVTAGMIALIALAGIADKLCDGYLSGRAIFLRLQFLSDIMYKNLDADYSVIEDVHTRELADRAGKFTSNNDSGSEQTLRSVRDLLAGMLGLALYSFMISSLSLWVLAGLVGISIANYIAAWLYNRYEFGLREVLGKIWNREWYLLDKCADFKAGKDIRIYGIANWFKELGARIVGEESAIAKKREVRRFYAAAINALLLLLRDGWAYLYLIMRIMEGKMSVPDFVLYFGVVTGFSTWVNGVAKELINIHHASYECSDFRAFVDLPDKQNRGPGAPLPRADEMPPEFTFANVKYTYPGSDRCALDISDLRIPKGQKLAVVGRNGAGKTTFVKMLTGIYMPDSGEILVNGLNVATFNRDEYYDLFTAVFQEFTFLPGSIAENVALQMGDDVDRERVADCLKSAGLFEKIASLKYGMDTHMIRDVSDEAVQFSGGEQQRLVLARALYKGAPVLVLDEPTAALDPIAESDMYMKYASFAKDHTSVFISHRLASTRFCDRILFIEDGWVLEDGTHDELMALWGKYRAMFDIQSHYYKEAAADE